MPLPIPRKSTATHFYKYRSPANLPWLKDTLHRHEIYLPNLRELNDDNDGLPHLAMQTEQQMADFLYERFQQANPLMSPDELARHEAIIRYNVRLHGPAALHPNLVELMDAQLKDFRVYSMTKRYDMGNLWALYADNHRGCCLEFQNVGPLFEHAKDVAYLDLKDLEISVTDPGVLHGHFLFCKTREWRCEEEVRLVLSRIDGRSKVQFNPEWLTRIILGKAMSEENKDKIRAWAKERQPELKVVTTYYDPTQRAIRLKEDEPERRLQIKGKRFMTNNSGTTFGNPDFVKTTHAAFPRFFEVLPRAVGALNELTSRVHPNPSPLQLVVINLGLLLGISMFELVTLAENGLGQGAMKIARTAMETAINAEYLRQFPNEFDQYVDWYIVEKYRELGYVRAYMPEVLPSIDPASMAAIEQEFDKVKVSFQKPNGDLRSSWCSFNLADRAAKAGFSFCLRANQPTF